MGILSDPTPDMLDMPRFDDGPICMQELLSGHAEQLVNAVMDAETDQSCGNGATAATATASAASPSATAR